MRGQKNANFTILNSGERFATKDDSLGENYKLGRGIPNSKTKNQYEKPQNQTPETYPTTHLRTGQRENKGASRRPENYKVKDLERLDKPPEDDMPGLTLESLKSSENSDAYNNPVKNWMDAAAGGIRDKLEKYLKSGKIQDINTVDASHKTALHYAVSEGRYKTVCYLLNLQINPNLQTKSRKDTALHLACRKVYK